MYSIRLLEGENAPSAAPAGPAAADGAARAPCPVAGDQRGRAQCNTHGLRPGSPSRRCPRVQAELAGPVATRLLQIPRRARGTPRFALVSAACRVRLSGERDGERVGGCAGV